MCSDSSHVIVKMEDRTRGTWEYLRLKGERSECINQLSSEFPLEGLSKAKFASYTSDYALIPNEHYNRDAVLALAESHFFVEKGEVLHVDSVYSQGIKNIFKNDTDSGDYGLPENCELRSHHGLSTLISFLPKDRDRVYAIFGDGHIAVLGMQGGKLQLAKIVQGKDEDTWLYEIMNAFEATGLHPHEHQLFLGGRLLDDSTMYKLLYRFVSDINWLSLPEGDFQKSHMFYDAYLLSKYF